MIMQKIMLPNALATYNFGKKLGEYLPEKTTILLNGNLGAGKTTLIQGIGSGLGIKKLILSPTFTLINEYTQGRLPLYHLDLYRLSPSDIQALTPEIYWEGIEVMPGITTIEWAQRLPYKPDNYLDIELIYSDNGRKANLNQIGKTDLDLSAIIKSE